MPTLIKKLFLIFFVFWFNFNLIIVKCWQGICEIQGLIDVGASASDGSCSTLNAMPQSDRCCIVKAAGFSIPGFR